MTNRADLPCPDVKVGDRVLVTNKIILGEKHQAKGIVKKINGKVTNDYISVGVEFDEMKGGGVYYFYPFEIEVL